MRIVSTFARNLDRDAHPANIRYNLNLAEDALSNEFDSEPPGFPSDRGAFLNLAGALEGGIVVAALGLAWLLELDLWQWMRYDAGTWLWSFLGLLPLLAMFLATNRWPVGPLRPIKSLLLDVLGPPLAACRWYDLVLLAVLAGLGEEWFFRGVVQMGLSVWAGPVVGLIAASALFGLLHAVTPAYAVIATLIGAYFGVLMLWWEPPNLTVPIVIHAVYDWIAFALLRSEYRRHEKP